MSNLTVGEAMEQASKSAAAGGYWRRMAELARRLGLDNAVLQFTLRAQHHERIGRDLRAVIPPVVTERGGQYATL